MYTVYINEVKGELDSANYVSLQADETTDVSCKSQFVIVLRYVKNTRPVERFISFVDVRDRTAHGLTTVLLHELELFNLKDKLIAQAYDGAAVMSGSRGGVQVLMKEHFPHAQYIHCYAHQLNLVLKKVCSIIKRIRIFFANISGISPFFTVSPKRSDLLREVCNKCIPTASETRWNFHSRILNFIAENTNGLLECFECSKTKITGTIEVYVRLLDSKSCYRMKNLFSICLSSILCSSTSTFCTMSCRREIQLVLALHKHSITFNQQ